METNFAELLALCGRGQMNIHDDSRRVCNGDIFVAIPGTSSNGEDYIVKALEAGAAYAVCRPEASSRIGTQFHERVVTHKDPRRALWELAVAKWRTDETPMRIIGITGTNGKTTSAYLLEHLFTQAGYRTGVLGTISYHWPGFSQPSPLTTPDPLQLHGMLARMASEGVNVAVMEISSHALDQQRVGGLPISGAIFTNLTQDHLDYHKNMENYFRAKARLFTELPNPEKAMAINGDDSHGRRLLELKPRALSFGLHSGMPGQRHLLGRVISEKTSGLHLKMSLDQRHWELRSPLVGSFNALNLLGVQALALEMGLEPEHLTSLESFHGVPGRLERIPNDRNLNIFVDYAHTPDALVNALKALRGAGFKRIITVFGCGGNRDRTKRPIMGRAVAKYSDVAILTSDNPRCEDPESIMQDVKPGLAKAAEMHLEVDRRQATMLGIKLMNGDDALLIAGKGHENYQIIGDKKYHYSDQEVVRELLPCA